MFSTIMDAGPSLLSPTTMFVRRIQGDTTTTRNCDNALHGLPQTANQRNAAWLEVLNVTGKGVILFMGITADDSDSVSPCGIKLVVDGVTCFSDNALSNSYRQSYHCLAGGFWPNGATGGDAQGYIQSAIPFFDSFVVDIYSDGADYLTLTYQYYLT